MRARAHTAEGERDHPHRLEVDADAIERFVEALFRYADAGTWASLRAFRDDRDATWDYERWPWVQIADAGLDNVVTAAVRFADRCANAPVAVVCAPPVATFRSRGKADQENLANGLALSVECDANAAEARRRLEGLLGPATVVVASGGAWTDPSTGAVEDRLHLHWRLSEPTREPADHARLKHARGLAQRIVGADATNDPAVHPIRWPGTWHRKRTPRLARIVAITDAEIELQDAIEALEQAAPPEAAKPNGASGSDPQAPLPDILAALYSIPNNDLPWDEWNRVGMAIWRATGGSEAGRAAFLDWSSKSSKAHGGASARWDHYHQSPPTEIGAGSLFHMARQHDPAFTKPTEANATSHGAATADRIMGEAPKPAQDDWPAPPDPAAYHGLAGEIVRTIEPHTEADPVAILVQFLVAFGNAAGRCPYFVAEADRHAPNLFTVLVGETSKGRKGTSWGQARRPVVMADGEWSDRIQSGLSSGEGLIWQVRDAITRREAIKEKGKVKGYQEIEVDPGVADKRFLIFEGEFALVLRTLNREGNSLSAIIRNAWDRGDLRSLTKNSPARATGAHISIIGHITRDELLRYLDDTETANGFGNRFIWCAVRRSKSLPEGGTLTEGDLVPLADRVREALAAARKAGAIWRDAEATEAWRLVYTALSKGRRGMLGAMLARSEAQVMRLATIYALLDQSRQIGRAHLEAALAVWEYAERSAAWVFGERLGDPVADAIMTAMKGAPDGLSRTEIRDVFGRHQKADAIDRALQTLAEAGKAAQRTVRTRGRPSERWFATDFGRNSGAVK